jgi:hypothetical protein
MNNARAPTRRNSKKPQKERQGIRRTRLTLMPFQYDTRTFDPKKTLIVATLDNALGIVRAERSLPILD